MKVMIKGGIWKNTEDEILKAAIMKYGKWARISSLLVRKTPKQCKSRWYEWLDPSIKKTEWAKDEDERLLHLAKLMPAQWRTIAPIVGRTPVQCLDRYQRLLDEAEQKDTSGELNAEDIRRLRPGEVDPDPEAKPARPDPVDMDEDEKEMLSEARARLANTQGKKAKRKAREKQLDEARRMALIQKRRELRAAGMDINVNKHLRGTDYNLEIPFFTKAPPGFYDVAEEREVERLNPKNLINRSMQELDGRQKVEESVLKKMDAKRQRQQKAAGDFAPQEALRQAMEAETKRSDRRVLNLPAPQVTDAELEEIVKIGYAGESIKALVGNEGASKSLMHEYTTDQTMRTPRLAPGNFNTEHTPMLSAKPIHSVAHTPNYLTAHLTPRVDQTMNSGLPQRTPFRDEMGINTPLESWVNDSPRVPSQRPQLARLFSTLPQPKNDFSIVAPVAEVYKNILDTRIEDAEDVLARAKQDQARAQAIADSKMSRAVFLDLPRPLSFNAAAFEPTVSSTDIDLLILVEMKSLVMHDTLEHPPIGSAPPSFTDADTGYVDLDHVYLEEAQSLIDAEYGLLQSTVTPEMLAATITEITRITHSILLVDAAPLPTNALATSHLLSHHRQKHQTNMHAMKRVASLAGKSEKKAISVVGEYQQKCAAIAAAYETKRDRLRELEKECVCFGEVEGREGRGIASRLEGLGAEVMALKVRELGLQDVYRGLIDERNSYIVR